MLFMYGLNNDVFTGDDNVLVLIVMLYTLSKAFGICDMGVYKTITMDFTQSNNRGKLNMLDAIINGCSNFVIMLGGILCE